MLAGCANALPPQAQPVGPPPPPPANPINPFNPTDGRKQLVVGVDDLGPGFNPHLISDLSPVSTAVASLVLPSVFRPGPGGQPVLDPTVATSATVTSTAPFTVSYELNLAAAWSDNTPIAAEDFVYLWQRMRSEPGVVDNAGYRLITDVRSRAGGKAVDVTFAQAYPQWRELFSDLLPAHLLKDAPQGWRTALTDNIPVSGGPFAVTQVDRDRGQLVLARNDHYWATPAVLDNLALRRSDTTSMLDGLRGGDVPVAQTWADTQVAAALAQLDSSVRRLPVPQPIVVQLGMRTDQGVLSDQRVRQAVGALLNRDTLIGIGTGGGNGGVRDDAQLLAPSQPGYQPTAPPGAPSHPDPALAATLLSSAGYQRDAAGRWTLLDTPLSVTIGAPTGRPRFAEIAQEIQRELRAGGITATVVTAQGSALFTDPTVVPTAPSPTPSASPSPGPPLAAGSTAAPGVPPPGPGVFDPAGAIAAHPGHGVLSAPAAGPPRSTQAAQPGQPAQPGQVSQAGQPGPSGQAGPSSSPNPAPAAAASGVLVDLEVQPRAVGADLASTAVSNYGCPPGMSGVAQPARNPTGFCSAALQPTLDALLGGAPGAAASSATIEAQLWKQLPAIPLFQIVTTLVSTPTGGHATGILTAGQLTTGPFATAPRWQPTPVR
jgi:ABC-type transport system substrate-binding protein